MVHVVSICVRRVACRIVEVYTLRRGPPRRDLNPILIYCCRIGSASDRVASNDRRVSILARLNPGSIFVLRIDLNLRATRAVISLASKVKI